MIKEEIIKALRDMARYPTVTLPRDSEALKAAADLLAQPDPYAKGYADAMNWKVQNHIEHLPVAQPEQEPLEYWNAVEGWVKIDEVREHFESVSCGTIYKHEGEGRVPLYTTPPQRKPLTDEEIEQLEQDTCAMDFPETVRAIEAVLRSKNT